VAFFDPVLKAKRFVAVKIEIFGKPIESIRKKKGRSSFENERCIRQGTCNIFHDIDMDLLTWRHVCNLIQANTKFFSEKENFGRN